MRAGINLRLDMVVKMRNQLNSDAAGCNRFVLELMASECVRIVPRTLE